MLGYFRDWKESIETRQGEFTANARAKMFVSWQTHEGLQITVYSIIELVKYLLQEGMEYVLTEKFCQDPCEAMRNTSEISDRWDSDVTIQTFKHSDIMITPLGFRDTFRKIQGMHEEGMRKVVIING